MAVDLESTFSEGFDPAWPEYGAMLAQLQGNILRGHGRGFVQLLLFQIRKRTVRAARDALKQFCLRGLATPEQLLTTAAAQQIAHKDHKGPKTGTSALPFMNVFLTRRAYEVFSIAKVPADPRFFQGMKASQEYLNDPPAAAWDEEYQQPIDGMILIADNDEDKLDDFSILVQQSMEKFVAEKPIVERGKAWRNKAGDVIEHFGYLDGRSQPLFLMEAVKAEAEKKRGGIDWAMHDGYDPRSPLGLVLVPDPGGVSSKPGVESDGFGSYLVYRKLEQNVRRFKQLEKRLAENLGLEGQDAERAGALAVGRFEDGTPIARQKDGGLPSPVTNNFNYSRDNIGLECPLQAHIRKVNPRLNTREGREQRIVRRGITYGDRVKPPDEPHKPDEYPEKDVGLLFLCFQAKIEKQFESIQRAANDTSKGLDPIIGQLPYKKFLPPGQYWCPEWGGDPKSKQPADFGDCVKLKGGEYFFAPSLQFFKNL